jgi:hypothetical protein
VRRHWNRTWDDGFWRMCSEEMKFCSAKIATCHMVRDYFLLVRICLLPEEKKNFVSRRTCERFTKGVPSPRRHLASSSRAGDLTRPCRGCNEYRFRHHDNGPRCYIAIAARTLGRCGTAFVLRETVGDAGFRIIYNRTSQTSRVPVPMVFPRSSWRA